MSRLRASTHLRFDENEVNKEDNKVMFYIFVCKTFAVRTLCQSDTFSQRSVVSFAICRVEVFDGSAAGDTYRHVSWVAIFSKLWRYISSVP